VSASIELRNAGTATWDSNTHLGTTEPRDRTSAFAAPGWLSPSRPAGVTGTVPPGQTWKFQFDLKVPAQPGMYDEHFSVVEDGVAWFGDPGQGGPPDNQIEAKIQVVAGPPPDASSHPVDGGAGDGGAGGGGLHGDGGAVMVGHPASGCAIAGRGGTEWAGALLAACFAALIVRRRRG
jgi:hypothetical protein